MKTIHELFDQLQQIKHGRLPLLAPGGASYIKFNSSLSLLSELINALERNNTPTSWVIQLMMN